MKKYFIVLPLIASCNGLSQSTVCNVNPQGQSNKKSNKSSSSNSDRDLTVEDPYKYKKLSTALDVLEERFAISSKETESTFQDQVAYLRMLFSQQDLLEIQEKICKVAYLTLHSSAVLIKSPFALACYSGSRAVLDAFLDFIKSKNIKISMNDSQINVDDELNVNIIQDFKLSHRYTSYKYSPFEYIVMLNDIEKIELFIRNYKEVDKDGLLDLNRGLRMASFFGNQDVLKLLIEKGGSIDRTMIMNLIHSGHADVVITLYEEGLIGQEKLVNQQWLVKNMAPCPFSPAPIPYGNVFISVVHRYLSLISYPKFRIFPPKLSPEQEKEELESLKEVLKISMSNGIDVLEFYGDDIPPLVSVFGKVFRKFPPYDRLKLHDLIQILSLNRNFQNVIDIPFHRNQDMTIRKLVRQYGLLETLNLLSPDTTPACSLL